LSKPIYQAINSTFFDTQNISSKPLSITKEFVFEKAVMANIGNVTNNMTFINTYLPRITQFKLKEMGQLKLKMVKPLIGYLLT
jgi:hypothetical protein